MFIWVLSQKETFISLPCLQEISRDPDKKKKCRSFKAKFGHLVVHGLRTTIRTQKVGDFGQFFNAFNKCNEIWKFFNFFWGQLLMRYSISYMWKSGYVIYIEYITFFHESWIYEIWSFSPQYLSFALIFSKCIFI